MHVCFVHEGGLATYLSF